jgi:NAD-dependent deacetylase
MKSPEPFADAHETVHAAASLIRSARYLTAFTGAGISVESGIPPFRGPGGLWGKYDPHTLELDFFLARPENSWPVIREIFYDNFGKARPNAAHFALARLELEGWPQEGTEGGRAHLRTLITQNIDNLHYTAGSRNIVEFHGNSRNLLCLSCGTRVKVAPTLLENLPPHCICGGIYKPDFIFFGEGIPPEAHARAHEAALQSDVMLVVGSTGEVYPAALVPRWAAEAGAKIIEINPGESEFTGSVTTLRIPLPAGEAFLLIEKELFA